jgi:putative membrane protein
MGSVTTTEQRPADPHSAQPGRIMNTAALAVLLLLLGGITLRICVTGAYLNYVKPGLLPVLVAAGLALLGIGGTCLWYELRPAGPHQHAADHDAQPTGHDHSQAPAVAWLLLLPVAALALFAPPALGADAAGRAGTALTQPEGDFPPLADADPVPLSLLDYASRAVFDDGQSLSGRRVQLTGFVTLSTDGQVFLTRMMLQCCAADARPIKVGLRGAVPAQLAPDTWLQVVGTYTATRTTDEVNGAIIPFIDVASAEAIDKPRDPYSF